MTAAPAFAQMTSSEGNIRRRVPANQISRDFFAWGLNPDCTVRRGFSVLITGNGSNGQAWVEKGVQTVDSTWVNSNTPIFRIRQVSRCLGQSAPVLRVLYEPRKGFTGFDVIRLTATNAIGTAQRHLTIRIKVGD